MARIKMVYIGGGSTRAAGTMSSFIARGSSFNGSEIVLVDLDRSRLELIQRLTQKMAKAAGVDLRISVTTNRREALNDATVVLTSLRPGGFEARHIDESVPLKYGIIGQETQGPGGFFMALRSVSVTRGIVEDMEKVCPDAWLFNYTNLVNIVAQAVADQSDIKVVSLCEGPLVFPQIVERAAGLDPDGLWATMIGINHNCWSVRHEYYGRIPSRLSKRLGRNGATIPPRVLWTSGSSSLPQ
ncbi:MAG: hypothetical protein OWU33_01000 [Firmicutes bacterium]|nr:hypothetical protein [Bacillota bacterium]